MLKMRGERVALTGGDRPIVLPTVTHPGQHLFHPHYSVNRIRQPYPSTVFHDQGPSLAAQALTECIVPYPTPPVKSA